MDVLLELLQSFGFPAFMCFMMFRYLEKTDDKRENQNLELIKAVQKNAIILTKVATQHGIEVPLDDSDVS